MTTKARHLELVAHWTAAAVDANSPELAAAYQRLAGYHARRAASL